MLQEAVQEARREERTAVKAARAQGNGATAASVPSAADEDEQPAAPAVRVDLGLDAQLPDDYVSHMPARLALYQRFTGVRSRQELKDLETELRDRFGPPPPAVANLFAVVRLRLQAAEAGVAAITRESDTLVLHLRHGIGGARVPLERHLGNLCSVGNEQVRVSLTRMGKGWLSGLEVVLERLRGFMEKMRGAVGAR
jgi:transcription-repair coupling factor (superfamily II helicase)